MFVACRWAASFLDSGSSLLYLEWQYAMFLVLLVNAQELRHRLEGLGKEEISVFYFLGCPVPSFGSVFL